MTTGLVAIHILAGEIDRATDVYRTITGTEPEEVDGGVRLAIGDASIRLHRRVPAMRCAAGAGRGGVFGVDLVVDDLDARTDELLAARLPFQRDDGSVILEANGVSVMLSANRPVDSPVVPATAALDHVALLVKDLDRASEHWRHITGVTARQMGLHPISGGAFGAARVILGPRMIELICPTPGVDSAIARRLAVNGEGPVASALPVSELEATLEQLRALEVRVDHRDPHWMVHPKHASGVLVQLTSRIEH